MAKEQSLSLNPTKISGVCGRLMCCLKYEEETYEYLNSKLPNVGDTVTTSDGIVGEVSSVSVLRQKVKILITDEEGNKDIIERGVDDLKIKPGKRKKKFDQQADKAAQDELKELEALERKEGKSKFND